MNLLKPILQKILDYFRHNCSNNIVVTAKLKASPSPSKVRRLALAPINKGVKVITTKQQCLKPWAVVRQLPHLKWVIIARYCSRSDADGHLLLLPQRVPKLQVKVVFERLDCKQ